MGKKLLSSEQMDSFRAMWVDPTYSVSEIASHFGLTLAQINGMAQTHRFPQRATSRAVDPARCEMDMRYPLPALHPISAGAIGLIVPEGQSHVERHSG